MSPTSRRNSASLREPVPEPPDINALLLALAETPQTQGTPGFYSVTEMVRASRLTRSAVMEALKRLYEQGRLESHREHRDGCSIDGLRRQVPVYRIKES